MRIPVVRKILQRNAQAAFENRERFDAAGVACINILGGPGCGKTSLLEAALPRLRDVRIAVLEGDLETTRDAERIAALNVPVVQLLTDGGCHLTATLVQQGLANFDLNNLDLIIIENVGNPICPANYGLGEHARVAVVSVTEGDEKPSKYPLIFKEAPLAILSKCDLIPHTNFDAQRATQDIRQINPSAEVLRADIRTGQGINRLAEWLKDRARRLQPAAGTARGSR
jgi:hydrogenase nickel incorporation protein HypB